MINQTKQNKINTSEKRNCLVKSGIKLKLILLLISFLFQTPIQAATKDKLYDVVIIGGGLSGLSAAYELKGYDSVILEKDNHVGGRVLTQEKNGLPYELGAVFRYDNPATLPPGSHIQNYSREEGSIAINYKGKIFYCDNVMGCITQLGLDQQELEKIYNFKNSQCSDVLLASFAFSKESYKILNSLFKMIHPGEINDYICARQKDLFIRWPIEYYPGGNSLIVDAFKKSLSSKIELNAEVASIEDYGKHVITTYRQGGRIKKVFSKAVIVTTPAPVTKKILGRINPECLSFLDSIRYGKFTVVAIGFKDITLSKFSYLFTPDFLSTVVISKRLENKKISVLLIYYGDKGSRQQSSDSDATIIDRSIDIIHRLNIGNFTNNNILFTDIKRWDYGGTIISDSMFKDDLGENYSRPSKRVFLAGDYVFKNNLFPYGMGAAIRSGKTAAQKVINLLKVTQDCNQSCFEVDGIAMPMVPDQKSIGYLSKIQPAIFGLVNNPDGLKWIEGLDQRKVFGYDFFKFYGSTSFSILLQAEPFIHNTVIIGYCPNGSILSEEEFSQRIELLRKKFPNKKILIGPCVNLFVKVNKSNQLPDILGFEIFEKNFDEYLNGKYDDLIKKTLENRVDVFIFITLFEKEIDLEKLERVLKKAKSQQLQIGYGFDGNEKLFNFILKHLCP